ncbi:MAG: MSCRAMM family protein, partial [Acidimicrobiales bacterium]
PGVAMPETGEAESGTAEAEPVLTEAEAVLTEAEPGRTEAEAEPGPAGPGPSEPAPSLGGQVTTASGTPLPGATVTVIGPHGDEVGQAMTDEDGCFAVQGLGAATYTVVAAAPHFRAGARVVATHGAGASASLTLLGVGSIGGRVTRAKDGTPLGAEVQLLNGEGAAAITCPTDLDGSFSLPDVLEGDYELHVLSPGYRPESSPVTVQPGNSYRAQVNLTGLGHLYGAVRSADGAWVAGVPVTLTDSSGAVVATTSTDGAGSYQFPGLVEGRYLVSPALAGPVTSAPAASAPASSARAVVDVDAGRTVAADLTLGSA